MARRLRAGFTTGACAAAAAQGAARCLLGRPTAEVCLDLPWGRADAAPVRFTLVRPEAGEGWAACSVIKDAGDDPDVTDGLEVRATVAWEDLPAGARRHDHSAREAAAADPAAEGLRIRIDGGRGVGRVTKAGLAVPPGEAAINPVPRQMIEAGVRRAFAEAAGVERAGVRVVVSVPEGEGVARRTLNERLGIRGGLSILGTTGVVIPMSAHAWTATIDAGLDVARAAGLAQVVLAHGRSSEAAAQRLLPELPPEAFVLMGDYLGHSLDAAAGRGLRVLLAGQFAKFCKVAGGHFATHVRDSALDLGVVARLLRQAGFPAAQAQAALGANTAREVFQTLLRDGDRGVFQALAEEVAEAAARRVGGAVEVEAVLFGYDKSCLARARRG